MYQFNKKYMSALRLMKSTISACLSFLLFLGCTSENITFPEELTSNTVNSADKSSSKKTSQSITPVYTFAEMEEVGYSKLVRTNNGISFRLQTNELEPGTVVTLWVVIFNNPENCVDGCNANDLANPDVQGDLQYASGRIIGSSGKATYAGRLNEGNTSESILPIWLDLPAHGLINTRKAEIHLIVHSHGPKISGLVNEMLHSFNAGCGPVFDPSFPPIPEELGTHGPNTCRDVQFAVHPLNGDYSALSRGNDSLYIDFN
jgi:hypothetical protein